MSLQVLFPEPGYGLIMTRDAAFVDHPEAPVCLERQLIGRTFVNRYRQDLKATGLGSGRHAFVFTPPDGATLDPARIDMQRSLDGASLAPSRVCIAWLASDGFIGPPRIA